MAIYLSFKAQMTHKRHDVAKQTVLKKEKQVRHFYQRYRGFPNLPDIQRRLFKVFNKMQLLNVHNQSLFALLVLRLMAYVITAVLPPLLVVYAQCGGPSEVMVTATHLSSKASAN